MQQATCAHSGADTGTSPGNFRSFFASRRSVLVGLAASPAIAVPSIASPVWSEWQWISDWHALGCGARIDGFDNLQLTPRAGTEQAACLLMADLNTAERLQSVISALRQTKIECPALRHIQRMEQIDREFVSDDVDPAANAVWMTRWADAYDRLERVPARTARGLAAKLRQGIEGNGSPSGDRIVSAALRQLERWS